MPKKYRFYPKTVCGIQILKMIFFWTRLVYAVQNSEIDGVKTRLEE